MPELVVSQRAAAALAAAAPTLPAHLSRALVAHADGGTMHGASSADLGASAPLRVSHRTLAEAAACMGVPLDTLLAGAAVYHAPRKKFQRVRSD